MGPTLQSVINNLGLLKSPNTASRHSLLVVLI